MGKSFGGIITLVIVLLIGAWIGAKWPSTNLLIKVIPVS